jgi:tripartite-type tricarboxylate transporter receptor subunit TctC
MNGDIKMQLRIKLFATAFATLLFLALTAGLTAAHAEWPDRPIRFVVPFGPGGANDLIARVAAEGVSKRLGQPVIIENKPGAGTVIGADYVAKSNPDGYTFLIGAAGVVTNSLLRSKMPYADDDLVPVGMIAVAPSVIVVHPSLPVNNMKEFVAYVKSKGSEGVNFATAGGGSTPHFVSEMLKEATGAQFTVIPYKSGQEGVNAVIGNMVTATSEASIVVIPQIKGGRLKAIATTYGKRISAYPELPTTAEQGYPSVNIGHWAGLFAPKGTPRAVMEKINAELQAALKSKETIDRLVPAGIEPAGGTQASFVAFINDERKRLAKVAKSAGMTAD